MGDTSDIVFNTDSKMNMALADIIKGNKKAPRPVGKQATVKKNTAAQRKQQQAQNLTKNARNQRQNAITNRRGITQSPQAQQKNGQTQQTKRAFPVRSPRSNNVGARVAFNRQQRQREQNAIKKSNQGFQGPVTRSQNNGQQANNRPQNLTINVVNDQVKQNKRQPLKQAGRPQRGTQRGTQRGARGGARGANVVLSRQNNQSRQSNAVNRARGIPANNRTVVSNNGGGNNGGGNGPSTLNDRFSNAPQNQPARQTVRNNGQQNNRQVGGGRGGRGRRGVIRGAGNIGGRNNSRRIITRG